MNGLAQPLRSWCGVPVAVVRDGVVATDLGPAIGAVRSAGRTLVLVSADPSALEGLHGSAPVRTTDAAVEQYEPERTLLRAPAGYAEPGPGWSLAVRRIEG